MADLKISQLSSATALAGTEVVPVVQGGSTKKATIDQILAPASGKGIDFAAAGGDVLTMYDEGPWTATLTASVAAPTTPVTTTGTYTRIGRTVTIQAYFDGVDTTGSSGDMQVTGLPFTVGTVRAVASVIMSGFGTTPAAGVSLGTTVYIADMTTATAIPMVAGGGKYLYVTMTYQM